MDLFIGTDNIRLLINQPLSYFPCLKELYRMIICPDCATALPTEGNKCVKCGWLMKSEGDAKNFLSTGDAQDSIFRKYIDLYEEIAQSELSAPINSDVYVRSMASKTVSLLGDINGKAVCDIGSGKGFLLQEIVCRGPKSVTAIDIASRYLNKIKLDGVNKVVANAENLPFVEEFDIAVSTDVIEHVLNVGSFMYCVNRMLKQDGIFVVRVPYRENLMQYGRHEGTPYPFTHLRTYNLGLLRDQIFQAGLKPIKVVFDGFQPAYPRALFKFGIGKWIFDKLVNDRYQDYWSVTRISEYLGIVLMRPIEVNMVCRKVKRLPGY